MEQRNINVDKKQQEPMPASGAAEAPKPASPVKAGRRGISRKGWIIIGSACAAVAAAIVALMLLLPRSFKSDEDVKEFIEEKLADMSDVNSKIAKYYKGQLKDMKAGLKNSCTEEQRVALVTFIACCGEKGAVEYLFDEKDLEKTMRRILSGVRPCMDMCTF